MRTIPAVLPTMREKKRYLAYEVIAEQQIDAVVIERAVYEELKGLLGFLGMAKAGIQMLGVKSMKGVLRVSRGYLDEVRTGLMMIAEIGKQQVIVRSLNVSGMLKKAQKVTQNKSDKMEV